MNDNLLPGVLRELQSAAQFRTPLGEVTESVISEVDRSGASSWFNSANFPGKSDLSENGLSGHMGRADGFDVSRGRKKNPGAESHRGLCWISLVTSSRGGSIRKTFMTPAVPVPRKPRSWKLSFWYPLGITSKVRTLDFCRTPRSRICPPLVNLRAPI